MIKAVIVGKKAQTIDGEGLWFWVIGISIALILSAIVVYPLVAKLIFG